MNNKANKVCEGCKFIHEAKTISGKKVLFCNKIGKTDIPYEIIEQNLNRYNICTDKVLNNI